MRQWRIGTISMGFLLIILGVLLLLKTFTGIEIRDILFYGWPVVLILLGLEVLIFSLVNKNESLKFSFFSIVIIFLAFTFTFFIYAIDEVGIFSSIERVIDGKSYTIDVNETLTIPANVTEISIDATNGDFKVIGKETDSLEVTGIISIIAENEEEANNELEDIFIVEIVGNRAIIKIDDSDKNLWFGNNIPKSDLNIVVPDNLYLKVNIVNGDIDVDNMNTSGKIENINGDVRLNNCDGDFDTDTINGKIIVNNNNGKIAAETTNGSISIEEIDGELNLKTTNGDIQVITSTIGGDWKISTLNGKITLQVPTNADAKIYADSDVSKVAGNIQWTNLDDGDNVVGSEAEAILGNGTYGVSLKTLSGKIEVNAR